MKWNNVDGDGGDKRNGTTLGAVIQRCFREGEASCLIVRRSRVSPSINSDTTAVYCAKIGRRTTQEMSCVEAVSRREALPETMISDTNMITPENVHAEI